MSTHPQPGGPHPEAEALSAFAEQALDMREREQVLAHLAACPRCRQIVALAQQAAEPAASAAQNRGKERGPSRPVWRKWRIAWAPVAALACVVTLAVAVHVRRVERGVESARTAQAPGQEAMAVPQPAPTTTVVAAPPPPAAPPLARDHAAPQKKAAPPSPQSVAVAAFSAQPAAIEPMPQQDRLMTSSKPPAPAAPPAATYYSAEAAAWKQQPATITAEQKQAVAGNERQAWKMAAARPAGSASQPPAQVNSLESPAAPPEGLFATRLAAPAPLPSGKPLRSTASLGRRRIAVDAAGDVFLSEDGGAHWSPVARQWSGQAVSVTTKPFGGAMGGMSSASPDAHAKAATPPLAAADSFEITNDKGQRWTSADGRVWTPE